VKKTVTALGALLLAFNLWADPMWAFDFKDQYLSVPKGCTHMSIHFYVVSSKFGKAEQKEEETIEIDYGAATENLVERHLTFSDNKEYTLGHDYDENGRIVAENGLTEDGGKLLMTRYEYGKDRKTVYSCLGEDRVLSATETAYDSTGREIEWTWYDGEGKVSIKSTTEYLPLSKIAHSYDSNGDEYEKRIYDYTKGSLITQKVYKVALKKADLLQFITEYSYNSHGLITLEKRKNVVEKKTSQTQYSYDAAGRLTEKLDINEKESIRTEIGYDDQGVLVSIKQLSKDERFGKTDWNLLYYILRELTL
jgi:YD repeat-containing protein